MEPTTEGLLERINSYVEELFAQLDQVLERNLDAAHAAGLAAINVSAAQGKLLYLIGYTKQFKSQGERRPRSFGVTFDLDALVGGLFR